MVRAPKRRFKPGTRVVTVPVLFGPAGMAAIGYSNTYPGGFAERMLVSDPMLIEIPNGLSDRQAAMTEPFAVGAHAVAKAAIDEPSAALVVGCGPVGLAVIASLKAEGYGPVAAADFSPPAAPWPSGWAPTSSSTRPQKSPHTKWADMGVPATGVEQMMARMAGLNPRRAIISNASARPACCRA